MGEWLTGRTALVTGASDGIGAAMVELLAGRCKRLILTSRRQEKLESIAEGIPCEVRCITADLSDPRGAQQLLEAVSEERIEVLVNNAGAGLGGPFHRREPGEFQGMIQLNVSSLVTITRELLLPMLDRGEGAILNVGSMAGFIGVPWLSAYAGSKAFVNNFSEGLRTELDGTGVRVCLLAPGTTHTSFFKSAGIDEKKLHRSGLSAEVVAQVGVDAIENDRAIAIPGWGNRWHYFALRLAPRSWVRRVARWIFRGAKDVNRD